MRKTVSDLMTTPVQTVERKASFKEIATTLREHRISAVPVVDDAGSVIGVVSEADLLVKAEAEHSWRAGHTVKETSSAPDAASLMTAPAITIAGSASPAEAARMLRERRIKWLPVVDESGRLIGIVTRSDLLKMFTRDDAEVQRDVRELLGRLWPDESVEAHVESGVVTLSGHVGSSSESSVIEEIVAGVEGAVAVRNQLIPIPRDSDREQVEEPESLSDVMGKLLPR
jgi:CBS-domain-containing membrane protein